MKMEKITEQIQPNQEEGELDIETTELQVEDLDFWTLSFLREHIDMTERIDFDPEEELEKIRKAVAESPEEEQSNQRILLMTSFKRKLKILRENMAQAQLELEKFIRENPTADMRKLQQAAEEISSKNNVSAQNEYFQMAIDSYFQAHTKIVNTIQNYKTRHSDNWQNKLFEDLFGQLPRGQIEIETTPINLYIKISNIEDYVIANGAPENIARSSGGASLVKEFPKVKPLSAKILIENVSLSFPEYSNKIVKPHEEEHSIHKNIYPRSAFIRGENNWLKDLGSNREIEPPLLNQLIHKSITNILQGDWLYQAKTEILAYMKNDKTLAYIKEQLTNPLGLYNYLDYREVYQNWFFDHLKRPKIKILNSNGQQLSEGELRIMYSNALEEAWHKRYLPMLEQAFQALEKMLKNYGSDKYPEIIRLLAQEPINKWPRLAKILS